MFGPDDELDATPENFRAVIAYLGLRLYDLAPDVGINPLSLGQQLGRRMPMGRERKESLARVLRARGGPKFRFPAE